MVKIRDERTIRIPILISDRFGSKETNPNKYTYKLNGKEVYPAGNEQAIEDLEPAAYIVAKPSDHLEVKGSQEGSVSYASALCYRWAYEDLQLSGDITVRGAMSLATVSARAGDVMLIEISSYDSDE